MGVRDVPVSPRSPEGRGRTLSPRVRSPRKGVRQHTYTLLLPLMGLVGMTVILSGSNLLNQTRENIDKLANDPHSAIRLMRMPARTMLNKATKKDRGSSRGESGVHVTSGSLFVDRNASGGLLQGLREVPKRECLGQGESGDRCQPALHDASPIRDGEAPLQELGAGDVRNGSREAWEQVRQLSEEEKRRPFAHAGLLMDGDSVVFAQRLQSEEREKLAAGNGTTVGKSNTTWLSLGESGCNPPGLADVASNGGELTFAGLGANCTVRGTGPSSPPSEGGQTENETSALLTVHRISRLSRWYRWNATALAATVSVSGRALSDSVEMAEASEQEEGGPGALPLWSLGIAELERGGENGTWLELADPSGDVWMRIYRAWLTRDRFLGLFSLLFLALHSNGTAAALAPPHLLCQVGANTARMAANSPVGGNSSLLLLHCPLAPTFSDQLKQARPDSWGDAQWRPNTVLLEPATLLPVTLTLLDSPSEDKGVTGLPGSTERKAARSSFTLKPLASLVRQPRFWMTACVGPVDTTFSRAEWVEFIEYHVGVVGVEHFFVYMPEKGRDVLHDYEREKVVTVVPWETSEVPGGSDRSAQDWRSLARNQCLWYNRGLAHWTLFLDSPTEHVQIGAQFGHGFGNWSASLGDDVAIVELPMLWSAEDPISAAGNRSLLLQRCTWPLPGLPSGMGERRALFAAGSKVRYIGRSPDLDQVTRGKQLQRSKTLGKEITVHACDRRPGRFRSALNESEIAITSSKGMRAKDEEPGGRGKRRQESGTARKRLGELSQELVRQLEVRVKLRMVPVPEPEQSAEQTVLSWQTGEQQNETATVLL